MRIEESVSDDELLVFQMRARGHFSPRVGMHAYLLDELLFKMVQLSNEGRSDLEVRSPGAEELKGLAKTPSELSHIVSR